MLRVAGDAGQIPLNGDTSFDVHKAYLELDRAVIRVVLPAYNEEANLPGLLRAISRALVEEQMQFEVIVVDDGSSDGTAGAVESAADTYPVVLVRHETNQGLGAAIRDGLFEASRRAKSDDVIVTMDADESHLPGLIIKMARMIREGHDVVIASRYQHGSRIVGLSWRRRQLSAAASLVFRVLFPTQGVRDFTCGYRAYRAGVLKNAIEQYGDAFVDQDGFACMVDIILKLRKQPVIFGEVPMILRYDLKIGQSKMNVSKTTRRTLKLILDSKFRRR